MQISASANDRDAAITDVAWPVSAGAASKTRVNGGVYELTKTLHHWLENKRNNDKTKMVGTPNGVSHSNPHHRNQSDEKGADLSPMRSKSAVALTLFGTSSSGLRTCTVQHISVALTGGEERQ